MNRTIWTFGGMLSASSLLLMDSAVKGTLLLALAAVAALILRRDSAATRHLVWMMAIVAMLILPVLSATLPQWRVLPNWMSSPRPSVAAIESVSPPPLVKSNGEVIDMPRRATSMTPMEVDQPAVPDRQPVAAAPISQPTIMTPKLMPTPMVGNWRWTNAIPLVWAIGFVFLMLRLFASRWMLSNSERLAIVAGRQVASQLAFVSRGDSATSQDPIVVAMTAICSQLKIRRPVTLLIHPHKSIPVVWGIFRCRLMLPVAARQWSDAQLQSVLMHELAHIKRRDTIVQLLTQVACALHWFNPLVWFAAWRLDVERERSCDDLVLASGIRPSAYAAHLLDVVSGLAPTRWTQACGLAMARKSSLEGRLTAVLDKDLNRRVVSMSLVGVALAIGVGIAVPIAMLRAANEEWSPPQSGEPSFQNADTTMKLQPATVEKLKWGEPLNGLRMALAWPPMFNDPALGKKPHFELVVQNVSEKEIHFLASDAAPNPRKMLIREGEVIQLALSDPKVSAADWKLQPGQCGVVRMFANEERDKAGTVPSSAIESDLSKLGRYHAIVWMEIAMAPAGAWTGKLVSGQSRGSADVAAAPAPMHNAARAQYEIWQRYARTNGDIPGALVGELAAAVKQFIKYNPTWETVPKLNEILPRLDATHDWKPADAIALLDEVAGVQGTLLEPAPWKGTRQTIRQGEALPKKYADASWGEEQPNGLRAAWVLEPSATEHRIGAALKARLLVQNRGQVPVMLQVPTWHQGRVKATDATGSEVDARGLEWTTMALLNTVRLGPGEYLEINTPGVGIGPRAGMGPWAGPRVGSSVLAKPGDELTLMHSPVPLDGSEVGVSEEDPHVSGPGWWLAHIKARLNRELPLPADAAERTRMLDRAVRELFAIAPTAEEIAEFIADQTPEAIDTLANRLAARTDLVSFSGKLTTAPVRFRVLDAAANADQQPRVVLGPGEYPLSKGTAEGGDATLKIVGRPIGDRRTNDAQILFEATEATGKLPPDPYELEVPDGWGTWAIVCRPSEGFFYLLSNGEERKIDYRNPRKIADTTANDLPAEFRDEVKRILDVLEVPVESQAEIFEKPAPPAAIPDAKTSASIRAEDYTTVGVHCQKFLREDAKRPDGRLMGHILDPTKLVDGPLVLGLRVASDAQWNIGSEARVELVVRNKSKRDVKFAQTLQSDVGLSVVAIDKDGKEFAAKIAPSDTGLLVYNRLLLPKNGYVAMVKSFTIRFDAEQRYDSELNVAAFHIPPGEYKLRCTWTDANPSTAHDGEWTGEIVNEELEFTLTEAVTATPVESPKENQRPITTIPVTSKELRGIWFGATERTGVVVRFIGRESKVKGSRGVLSGKWVVDVTDGSISAAIDFADDTRAGVVKLTASMWNDKTKQSYTSPLGSIERGDDDTLYLTIDDNAQEPMYRSARRIPLTFIEERDEIQRSDVEKMQALVRSLQQKKPISAPE